MVLFGTKQAKVANPQADDTKKRRRKNRFVILQPYRLESSVERKSFISRIRAEPETSHFFTMSEFLLTKLAQAQKFLMPLPIPFYVAAASKVGSFGLPSLPERSGTTVR